MTRFYPCAEVLHDGADELGEGPVWLPETGEVGWVDILGETFHRCRLDTGAVTSTKLGQPVSAVVRRTGGGLGVAAQEGVLLLDPAGEVERVLPVEEDLPGNRLSDAAVDPLGRLWFGTLDADLLHGRGALYRLGEDGQPVTVLAGTSISNGLGWSPDGRLLYFVDSATQRVDVLDFDPATGTASGRRPWVVFGDADGVPDGLAVDEEGGVWVALWRGGQVRRYDADGELSAVVPLPVRQVTSCAFGGEDLGTLFITTATVEMSEPERRAEPLAGGLFQVRTEQRGLAQPLLTI
ncbi:MAG: SMP-30/gluconolactonase/LRE family protein [Nocardioidaceae bacterium]|nr:SMP-30/gluconolactonase/LRE family protein [Nocardioidaceae bacterium]